MKFLSLILILFCIEASAKKGISINLISDLDFGTVVQGDLADTVAPGTTESSSNASFQVSGDKNSSYTIVLPSGSVTMSNTSGVGTLAVSSFRSFPSEGSNGVLDKNGHQFLFIGATRAAIPLTQPRGNYAGSFMVTVAYQ